MLFCIKIYKNELVDKFDVQIMEVFCKRYACYYVALFAP